MARLTEKVCPGCGVLKPRADYYGRVQHGYASISAKCKACHIREGGARGRARRAAVIAALGGACECCGETLPEMLNLDHRGGDGRADRGIGPAALVARVEQEPARFRVLCWNCNQSAKRHGGTCGHRLLRNE